MDAAVRIVEVGARDGLQNETRALPPEDRVELIRRLAAAGLTTIEAGAFVSPRLVPQMAGSDQVLRALGELGPGITLPVLVANAAGLDAALAAGARAIALFTAASDSFNRRNINCTVAESLTRFAPLAARARAAGLTVRGYLSCAIACPYDGPVAPARVAAVAGALAALGCSEISLGDTLGVGTPGSVRPMLEAVLAELPADRLAVHFHDSYGQALANILTGLDLGIRGIDSAVAGLGGCPFAPGASGNVATEDVVYLLEGLGLVTGVDLTALAETGAWIAERLGHAVQSRAGRALLARRR